MFNNYRGSRAEARELTNGIADVPPVYYGFSHGIKRAMDECLRGLARCKETERREGLQRGDLMPEFEGG